MCFVYIIKIQKKKQKKVSKEGENEEAKERRGKNQIMNLI